MAKVIKSYSALVDIMNKKVTIAVDLTAREMVDKLQEFILEEFYLKYSPKIYERSYSFLESAVYNMLNNNSAEIKMDPNLMSYEDPDWTGEVQIRAAEEGLHGGLIYRDGHYWSEFIDWCDDNVINLLKQNLRKHGLNIK